LEAESADLTAVSETMGYFRGEDFRKFVQFKPAPGPTARSRTDAHKNRDQNLARLEGNSGRKPFEMLKSKGQ
jgi:hypothetical protein